MNKKRIAARWTNATMVLVATLSIFAASPAFAELEQGDRCRLKSELIVEIRSGRGWVEVPLPRGSAVEVIAIVEQTARVRGDNIEGRAVTAALVEACQKPQQKCTLYKTLEIQEKRTLDGKAWRVKPGAKITMMAQDPTFTEVKVGNIHGYADSKGFWRKCDRTEEVEVFDDENVASTQLRYAGFPLRNLQGQERVALVPFVTHAGVDDNRATLFEDQLGQAILDVRKDTANFETPRRTAPTRRSTLKPHLKHLFKAGQKTNIAYIITGELKKVPDDPSEALEVPDETPAERHARLLESPGKYVLIVAVIDVANRKVLKTLRTRPSLKARDNWATLVSTALKPVLPIGGQRER